MFNVLEFEACFKYEISILVILVFHRVATCLYTVIWFRVNNNYLLPYKLKKQNQVLVLVCETFLIVKISSRNLAQTITQDNALIFE